MMKLAANAPDRHPIPSVDPELAIDLAHLARMTMGEARLEREVLMLFERQADILLARMRDAPAPAVAAFAHTLKGSARGVGAWRVAEAARAVEMETQADDRAAALVRLAAAVEEAKALIAEMLQAHS
jgi:HPt (histidine-containing phosphotransfer) domain-containing protein